MSGVGSGRWCGGGVWESFLEWKAFEMASVGNGRVSWLEQHGTPGSAELSCEVCDQDLLRDFLQRCLAVPWEKGRAGSFHIIMSLTLNYTRKLVFSKCARPCSLNPLPFLQIGSWGPDLIQSCRLLSGRLWNRSPDLLPSSPARAFKTQRNLFHAR